jgi:hypothetical protein
VRVGSYYFGEGPVTAFQLPTLRDRRGVSTILNVGELLNLVGRSTGVVPYLMMRA